jgi:hypothetical protein
MYIQAESAFDRLRSGAYTVIPAGHSGAHSAPNAAMVPDEGGHAGSPALAGLMVGTAVGFAAFVASLLGGSSFMVAVGIYSLAGCSAFLAVVAAAFVLRKSIERTSGAGAAVVLPGRAGNALNVEGEWRQVPEDWRRQSVARATPTNPPVLLHPASAVLSRHRGQGADPQPTHLDVLLDASMERARRGSQAH